ncbi:hypothetical protein Trydic_g8297 [Trypoxylus dichotomus]
MLEREENLNGELVYRIVNWPPVADLELLLSHRRCVFGPAEKFSSGLFDISFYELIVPQRHWNSKEVQNRNLGIVNENAQDQTLFDNLKLFSFNLSARHYSRLSLYS